MIYVGIVEDDEEIRHGVQEYLNTRDNIICNLAENSVELFLAGLKKDKVPDVVLMDIGLPGISGINGLRLIKEK